MKPLRWAITGWVLWAATLLPTTPAGAITIRHDVDDASYTALANLSIYQAAGRLLITAGGGSLCTGTLISPTYVLTAAHCVDNPAITDITYTASDGTNRSAASWTYHDDWTGSLSNGFDIAVVELASAINSVTPATLLSNPVEQGAIGTSVGYGKTGTGLTGSDEAAGTRRAGENVIDGFGGGVVGALNLAAYADHLMFSDFDSPIDAAESLMGSSTPLPLEASTAPGDSGGPTYIEIGGQAYVAGVTSFGASVDGLTDSDYGDIFAHTRVSQFIDWLQLNASGFSVGGLPEPTSLGPLSLLALATYLTQRRRRPAPAR